MKILFFINGLSAGGKERRLVELLKGLKVIPGIQFELVVMGREIHYKEVFDLDMNIHYLIRKSKKDLSIFVRLYKLCKKVKPDILHCWDSMTAFYSAPVCKLLNIRLVNGMVVETPVKRNISNRYFLRSKLSFPFSTFVVGNSNAGLKGYSAPESKSVCIYNGFNFNRIRRESYNDQELRQKYDISGRFIVAMVGGFYDRKDYETYIKAAKIICEKRDDTTFLAIGNGPNYGLILNQIGSKFKGYIKLPGRQTNVEAFLNFCDIGVLTTNAKVHGEGISNSILEYMAMGMPVIATVGGGTNEIVVDGKTGYLIPPSDPETLAAKIDFLLNDASLRKMMGEAGYRRIMERFSIQKMIDSYLKVYHCALKKRSERRLCIKSSELGV